jgi:arylsulfatase A-like enzyme
VHRERGVHVPLFVRAPFKGAASAGKYTDVLAELVDVYPTLSELAGLGDPRQAAEQINGTSLARLLDAPGECTAVAAAGERAAQLTNTPRPTDKHKTHRACRDHYVRAPPTLKVVAFSQYAKPCQGYRASCVLNATTCVGDQFHRNQTKLMGYSVRVSDWRYTV